MPCRSRYCLYDKFASIAHQNTLATNVQILKVVNLVKHSSLAIHRCGHAADMMCLRPPKQILFAAPVKGGRKTGSFRSGTRIRPNMTWRKTSTMETAENRSKRRETIKPTGDHKSLSVTGRYNHHCPSGFTQLIQSPL